MNCTPTAEFSEATWRMCFGGWLAICEFYGSKPQFICTSATIANPQELAEKLTGQPFEFIERAARVKARSMFSSTTRQSSTASSASGDRTCKEAQHIASAFLKRNVPAIVFANSRLITEILVRYLKDSLEQGPVPDDVVVGYRGGYLPNERRQIERGLREGRIRGVVSTNALELGIDIGSLDVSILAGYPGTIASTWQRIGRAGRRNGMSVGGAGRIQHAARPVHCESSRNTFLANRRKWDSINPGQHSHPAQSSSMRDFRTAVRIGRTFRRARRFGDPGFSCRARIHSSGRK